MGHLKCHGLVHTIEEGDSLYKIGKRYGVRVSELLFANPYLDLYNLQTVSYTHLTLTTN